jgi:hypothetical protein
LPNGRQYEFWCCEHFLVREPNNPVAERFEVALALSVIRVPDRIVVYRPVKLDYESFGGAVEVYDVRSDAVLAAKLAAAERAVLEGAPEHGFGRRSAGAQLYSGVLLAG